MNDYDLKSFNVMVAGKGKAYFEDLLKSEEDTFRDKDLHFTISEGFSTPEVTQVMISIGANVIVGLSVYYIAKIFDKIFTAKSKAKDEGQDLQIHVSISEKIIIKDVESLTEIEIALNLVIKTNSDK